MDIDQNMFVLLFQDIARIFVKMLPYYQISFAFDMLFQFILQVLYLIINYI